MSGNIPDKLRKRFRKRHKVNIGQGSINKSLPEPVRQLDLYFYDRYDLF